ncbi:uncharacterized protein [Ambystoma mexicanum]|uniref:uncharacterized protein n=1 Tax=Ambystoma mexicanum TaxID=8296 RepID=UPI0037E7DD39
MEVTEVGVQMSSVWVGVSAMVFHQAIETCGSISERARDQVDHLHGRYLSNVSGQGDSSRTGSDNHRFATTTGVLDKLGEVGTRASAGDGIPGIQLRDNAGCSQASVRQSEFSKERDQEYDDETRDFFEGNSKTSRPPVIINSGYIPRASVLQSVAEAEDRSSQERSILRTESEGIAGSEIGTGMVVLPHGGMEWQGVICLIPGPGDRIRRQPMGMWRPIDRREVVERRAGSPHQLPGTSSGVLRGSVLEPGRSESCHSVEDGQCFGSQINKSTGRNEIEEADGDGQRVLADMSPERNKSESGASARGSQSGSRLEFEIFEGLQRLSLDDSVFQEIMHRRGPCQTDLFASRLNRRISRFDSWRPDPQVMRQEDTGPHYTVGGGPRCY